MKKFFYISILVLSAVMFSACKAGFTQDFEEENETQQGKIVLSIGNRDAAARVIGSEFSDYTGVENWEVNIYKMDKITSDYETSPFLSFELSKEISSKECKLDINYYKITVEGVDSETGIKYYGEKLHVYVEGNITKQVSISAGIKVEEGDSGSINIIYQTDLELFETVEDIEACLTDVQDSSKRIEFDEGEIILDGKSKINFVKENIPAGIYKFTLKENHYGELYLDDPYVQVVKDITVTYETGFVASKGTVSMEMFATLNGPTGKNGITPFGRISLDELVEKLSLDELWLSENSCSLKIYMDFDDGIVPDNFEELCRDKFEEILEPDNYVFLYKNLLEEEPLFSLS